MNSRRIAVLGVCVVAAMAGIATWTLRLRETPPIPPPPLRSPPVSTTSVDPVPEVSAPFVARRTTKPPEPYLPPYVKPPHLLTEPVRPGYPEEIPKWPKLFGRVVSEVDQTPLRGAVIGVANEFTSGRRLRESVLMVDDVHAVVRADGNGKFEIEEPVVGAVFLATAPGFGPVLFDRDWLGRTHDAPFVIALAPSATFKARITDHVGAAKSGVEIRLVAAACEATHRSDLPDRRILCLLVGARRVTDENGQTTFAGLPSEVPFDVEIWSGASRARRNSTEIVLKPGQEISKEWRLGSGCTIHGSVVDDLERPVAGQKLLLTPSAHTASLSTLRASLEWDDEPEAIQTLRTDADGHFSIADVGPGKWWLGIAESKPSWMRANLVDFNAVAPVAMAIEVEPDRDTIDVLLRAHRGLYIHGTTVDPDGTPVLAGLTAEAVTGISSFYASTTSDRKTGEFAIGPLEPGEYRIRAEVFSLEDLPNSSPPAGPPLARFDSLTIPAGREDVVIAFRLGGSIRATARRADTGAEVAAEFRLVSTANLDVCDSIGFGEPIRAAGFNSLNSGTYAVSAVTADGRVGCVRDILVGEGQRVDNVDVRVEPGARLKLTYSGTSEEYAQVTIVGGATVFGADGVQKGTSELFVAPVGKVTVRWRAGSDHLDEEVELAVGETRQLSWPGPR